MMPSIEAVGLSAALLTGFVGSTHCFGMCGGLSAALGMRASAAASNGRPAFPLFNALLYQLGRIGGYAVIGAIAGTFSQTLEAIPALTHAAIALRVLSGILLLLIALRMLGNVNVLAPLERLGAKLWQKLQPVTRRLMHGPNVTQRLLLGFLWGWLPCGMVYSMAMLALLSGSALQGSLTMIAFGIGTLPSMLASTLFAAKLRNLPTTPWSRKLSAGVLAVFALFFIAAPVHITNTHAPHDHALHQMTHSARAD